MQSESPLSQEPQVQPPVMGVAPQPRKFNVVAILLTVFLCLFIAVTGWLGYRASQLNAQLEAARASLSALQGRYDTLTSEKQTLDGELAGVNTELASTQGELSNTEASLAAVKEKLAASEQEVAALTDQITRAGAYMNVMHNFFDDSDQVTITKARAVEDERLSDLLSALLNNFTNANYLKFIEYLLTTVQDILGE